MQVDSKEAKPEKCGLDEAELGRRWLCWYASYIKVRRRAGHEGVEGSPGVKTMTRNFYSTLSGEGV